MLIQFTIHLPPFSINKAYYRNRQLTNEARKWRANFLEQLQDPHIQSDLTKMHKLFDPKLHAFLVSYRFCYPSKKLLTKEGHISARSCDLTNIEKLVQDNVFDHRFNGREIEELIIQNLDIDDKFIIQCHSYKMLSPTRNYLIQIGIELVLSRDYIDPLK
tara:strand:+ start:311 stop:790 length:480 start_codon:yes stop_codon:yes gene_type:complete